MPLEEAAAEVFLTAINIALLVLVLVLLNRTRIDFLRHRLFVLRDELFDYALEHDVSFRAPAYVRLRSSINDLLRFAHKFDFTRYLLLAAMSSKFRRTGMIEESDRQWQGALAELEHQQHRNRIADIRERALLEVSKHMALGWFPWALVLSRIAFLRHLWNRCRLSLLRTARIVEIQARVLGHVSRHR